MLCYNIKQLYIDFPFITGALCVSPQKILRNAINMKKPGEFLGRKNIPLCIYSIVSMIFLCRVCVKVCYYAFMQSVKIFALEIFKMLN